MMSRDVDHSRYLPLSTSSRMMPSAHCRLTAITGSASGIAYTDGESPEPGTFYNREVSFPRTWCGDTQIGLTARHISITAHLQPRRAIPSVMATPNETLDSRTPRGHYASLLLSRLFPSLQHVAVRLPQRSHQAFHLINGGSVAEQPSQSAVWSRLSTQPKKFFHQYKQQHAGYTDGQAQDAVASCSAHNEGQAGHDVCAVARDSCHLAHHPPVVAAMSIMSSSSSDARLCGGQGHEAPRSTPKVPRSFRRFSKRLVGGFGAAG